MKTATVVLALCLATASARADVAADAQRLLSEGLQLLTAGDLNGARERFVKARDLVPDKANPHRLVGMVDAQLGRCAEAIGELEIFIAKVGAEDSRRTDAIALRDRCRDDLAPKVGTLLVDSEPSGAEVRLDDASSAVVGTTPYQNKALAIGHHLVFVRKSGFVPASTAVSVGRNETVHVQLALAPQPVAPPPAHVVEDESRVKRIAEEYAGAERQRREAEQREMQRRQAEASRAARPLRIAGPALFFGGLVIVGIGFSIVADANSNMNTLRDIQNQANNSQNGTSPGADPNVQWSHQADVSEANLRIDSRAVVSLVVIGGAATLAGAVVWIAGTTIRSHAEEQARQPTLSVAPLVAPQLVGLAAKGRF
jgi:hypothetical protein